MKTLDYPRELFNILVTMYPKLELGLFDGHRIYFRHYYRYDTKLSLSFYVWSYDISAHSPIYEVENLHNDILLFNRTLNRCNLYNLGLIKNQLTGEFERFNFTPVKRKHV